MLLMTSCGDSESALSPSPTRAETPVTEGTDEAPTATSLPSPPTAYTAANTPAPTTLSSSAVDVSIEAILAFKELYVQLPAVLDGGDRTYLPPDSAILSERADAVMEVVLESGRVTVEPWRLDGVSNEVAVVRLIVPFAATSAHKGIDSSARGELVLPVWSGAAGLESDAVQQAEQMAELLPAGTSAMLFVYEWPEVGPNSFVAVDNAGVVLTSSTGQVVSLDPFQPGPGFGEAVAIDEVIAALPADLQD